MARQRTPHGSGLGKVRWVVESTLSWVGQGPREVARATAEVGDKPEAIAGHMGQQVSERTGALAGVFKVLRCIPHLR